MSLSPLSILYKTAKVCYNDLMSKHAIPAPYEFYPLEVHDNGVEVLAVPTEYYSAKQIARLHRLATEHPERKELLFVDPITEIARATGSEVVYATDALRASHERAVRLAKVVSATRGTAADELRVQQNDTYEMVATTPNGLEHIFSAPIDAATLQNPQKYQQDIEFSHS